MDNSKQRLPHFTTEKLEELASQNYKYVKEFSEQYKENDIEYYNAYLIPVLEKFKHSEEVVPIKEAIPNIINKTADKDAKQKMGFKFCPDCGSNNYSTSIYCYKCGISLLSNIIDSKTIYNKTQYTNQIKSNNEQEIKNNTLKVDNNSLFNKIFKNIYFRIIFATAILIIATIVIYVFLKNDDTNDRAPWFRKYNYRKGHVYNFDIDLSKHSKDEIIEEYFKNNKLTTTQGNSNTYLKSETTYDDRNNIIRKKSSIVIEGKEILPQDIYYSYIFDKYNNAIEEIRKYDDGKIERHYLNAFNNNNQIIESKEIARKKSYASNDKSKDTVNFNETSLIKYIYHDRIKLSDKEYVMEQEIIGYADNGNIIYKDKYFINDYNCVVKWIEYDKNNKPKNEYLYEYSNK